MAVPSARGQQGPARIVFLTRDPVLHQRGGSTTYILGLLALLGQRGATITVVSTVAFSRSPRLFFRIVVAPPDGTTLRVPGYLRLGRLYLRLWQPKAWARVLVRAAVRWPALQSLAHLAGRVYGDALYAGAWDLTLPTAAERRLATREAARAGATVVLANYCLWGDLLGSGALGPARRTAILMHDLLSARTERFAQSHTPLDMPPLTAPEEMRRLAGAGTVLAAQGREAALVAPHVPGRVLVTPVVMNPRRPAASALQPQHCLFVGSNIPPNQAALPFLLHEVWPAVRAAVPTATLAIAGTLCHAPELRDAQALALHGVTPLGVAPSLENAYAEAAICLVPLLFGTGIKIKLLEALSFGKAIVSTSVGLEGLETLAAAAVSRADDAPSFAAAIVALLTNPSLRRTRENAAFQLATQHFGHAQPLDPAFLEALL